MKKKCGICFFLFEENSYQAWKRMRAGSGMQPICQDCQRLMNAEKNAERRRKRASECILVKQARKLYKKHGAISHWKIMMSLKVTFEKAKEIELIIKGKPKPKRLGVDQVIFD